MTEVTIPEVTPEKLVAAVEAGDEIQVLDVRAPQRLANGTIDIVSPHRFLNIKGSEVLALEDLGTTDLDRDLRVAVVCGLGNDSRRIAKHLNDHGFEAASVAGGMAAWMRCSIARELETPAPLDRFVQFDRIGKGALGYVLISDGEAFIVDPPRDVDAYVAAIAEARAVVVGVADTHAHADYISGGPALAARYGVPYHLHAADRVYPYDGTPGKVEARELVDGQRIRLGRAVVDVVHTPGHTEGSVSFRLGDHFVLTGDFIFVGSVGRPDLGGKTEEWTGVLWESLRRAKSEWPGKVAIYPAHYASAAERNADHTIGQPFVDLCQSNEPLAIDDGQVFARWIEERAGAFPDVYRRIKAINLGLETVDDLEAQELEAGKNQCALG